MMNLALEKDLDKEYIKAAKLYEKQIANNTCPNEDDLINLAFLYWSFAADTGFKCYYNIPKHLILKGTYSYPKVLSQALQLYPDSLELKFWQRYLPHREIFDDFPQGECEAIIANHEGRGSLIPYFYLYLFDEGKYKKQRDQLLEGCLKCPTAKNLHITAIIED